MIIPFVHPYYIHLFVMYTYFRLFSGDMWVFLAVFWRYALIFGYSFERAWSWVLVVTVYITV